jgi:uncharacterized protein with PQ loop repeat
MSSESLVIMFDVNNSALTPEEYFILENVIGYTANILIFFMMIPQIYKAYKFKLTDDISYKFVWISLVSSSLEIVYGVLINQIPVLITGIICLIQMVLLAVSKKLYDNPKEIKIQRKSSVANCNSNRNSNSNHKITQNSEEKIITWEVHDDMFIYIFQGENGISSVDMDNVDNLNKVDLSEMIKCVRVDLKK